MERFLEQPVFKTSNHHNKHWVRGECKISLDGLYRYGLSRYWTEKTDNDFTILFIMLNPSKADHENDDPTIRRCISFAKKWGATGIMVGNLYSRIATNPDEMFALDEIESSIALQYAGEILEEMAERCSMMIYAWGAFFDADDTADTFMESFPEGYHIGEYTKKGHPRHPLYLKGDLPFVDGAGRRFYKVIRK